MSTTTTPSTPTTGIASGVDHLGAVRAEMQENPGLVAGNDSTPTTTSTNLLESVQVALQDCDAMSQHGLDTIDSLAKLALLGLKSGQQHDLEHVEVAL